VAQTGARDTAAISGFRIRKRLAHLLKGQPIQSSFTDIPPYSLILYSPSCSQQYIITNIFQRVSRGASSRASHRFSASTLRVVYHDPPQSALSCYVGIFFYFPFTCAPQNQIKAMLGMLSSRGKSVKREIIHTRNGAYDTPHQ
jgi:hypothetical protein